MMIRYIAGALLFLALSVLAVVDGRDDLRGNNVGSEGTRWAVLVSGSNGYSNYRHQADVCHAYQILKRGGLKDENIVVFMYDDIANNPENPRPGVIINNPRGEDVYKGVPKDYVGDQVTADNFYAVILGNKTAVSGGSRKVIDSRPNDHIFIYYSDHGAAGIIGMPKGPFVAAKDLTDVLKKKHASGTYKSLVFYLEACDAGSMFDGLLPKGLNIYATTASNAAELSWGVYCDFKEFKGICLGDTYSVSWMEDSEVNNLQTETLMQQYQLVKKRTIKGNEHGSSSHVVQYGDIKLSSDSVSTYLGAHSTTNRNHTLVDDHQYSINQSYTSIDQRDADLHYFRHKFIKAPQGSAKKAEARKQLDEVIAHRAHVDKSVELIGKILIGIDKVMANVRPVGQPLVDDWDCLKSTVRTFERYCGSLSRYGMKHMRSFANMCNAGVKTEQMAKASSQACTSFPSNPWSSLNRGFTA
ncbi:hypothetical protein CASFOL_000087 [Castilleja foliolosa]|uniref:Legumain prodomain domain-containing protein n=1 Tax=Castilleja foliolosa TaxID=1961234 RepID=A0ABD3ER12_9LAMI